jgi:hypothetical protein
MRIYKGKILEYLLWIPMTITELIRHLILQVALVNQTDLFHFESDLEKLIHETI